MQYTIDLYNKIFDSMFVSASRNCYCKLVASAGKGPTASDQLETAMAYHVWLL